MPGDGKVIVTAWEGSELNVDTDRELTDNAIKKTNQQNHGSIDLCEPFLLRCCPIVT
jgi:hypothetical protein